MLSISSEKKLEQFEAEWNETATERIDEFLADVAESERLEMLAELIMIDLERRCRSGHAHFHLIDCKLADYCQQYPELEDDPILQRKIITHTESLLGAFQNKRNQNESSSELPSTVIAGQDSFGSSLVPPCWFGHLRLLRIIKRGGMGAVYEAEQQSPNRVVAVKVLHTDISSDAEAVARFERESQLISTIENPRVVPVYESGSLGNHRYFVMPFYRGGTLRDRIQRETLSGREAARILLEVTRAVAAVHKVNVVHRDLKPSNILFGEDGLPVIADFGLSRHIDQSRTLTHTGQIYGTPGYLAPEKISFGNKETNDFAVDIYALGAILYDMLCGRPPFRGPTAWETLKQARSDLPVSPRRLNPQVDADLSTICLKCLETKPEHRYTSCDELANDLDNYLQGSRIRARRPSLLKRARRYTVRHPAQTGLLAACSTLLIVVFVALYLEHQLSLSQMQNDAQETMRRIEVYGSRLATVDHLIGDRSMGWREEALQLLEEAAHLDIPDPDQVRLRSLVATASVHRDLVPVATLAEDMWCDAVAFDPTGNYLALGQNKDINGFKVLIYRVDDLQATPYRLWIDCKTENDERRARDQPKSEDGARALCFSNDGTQLAVGTRHGRLHLYRWTGEQAEWLETHDPDPGIEVWDMSFSADGETLWTRSYDNKLRIIREGVVKPFPPVEDLPVTEMAVSPTESAVFLQFAENESILRFDENHTKPTWQVTDYQGVNNLNVSLDGRFLGFTYDKDQRLNIVDTERGFIQNEIHNDQLNPEDAFGAIEFGHASDWIVSSTSDRSVSLWDVARRRLITSYIVSQRGGRPQITTSPKEPLIAVAEHLKVTVYRVTGNEIMETVSQGPGIVRNIASDASGSRLATIAVHDDRRPEHLIDYELRDLTHNQSLSLHRVIDETRDLEDELPIQLIPGEAQLLTASSRSSAVTIPTAAIRAERLHEGNAAHDRWIPANEIEISGMKSEVQIQDDRSWDDLSRELTLEEPHRVHFLLPRLPDEEFADETVHAGRDVYVLCRWEGTADPLHVKIDSRAIGSRSHSMSVRSHEGTFTALWVGLHKLHYPREPLRIDLEFDHPLSRLIVDGVLIRRGRFNELMQEAVGEALPVVSEIVTHEQTGRIWAVADEEHLVMIDYPGLKLVGHCDIQSISQNTGRRTFRPLLAAGPWIVAGTTGGEMFVFDAESMELVRSATPLDDRVRCLCEIPEETLIAAGGSDGLIQLLELPSLTHRQSLAFHTRSIESLCFDSIRRWLIAGSEDGTISVYQTSGKEFELYFKINLRLGRVQKLFYMPEVDALAVLIKNETAVRLIHLDHLCERMRKLGLL